MAQTARDRIKALRTFQKRLGTMIAGMPSEVPWREAIRFHSAVTITIAKMEIEAAEIDMARQ